MRAIIYLRQSLDSTGEELGVQRQEAECRRLSDARGYDVIRVIKDNSVSASKGKRAGYVELLRAIEAKECDVVVVLRLDRLLRKLTDLEHVIELTERTGVSIATVQGDLDLTNAQGRLLGRILASVARSEVETKGERQRLANAQRAARGLPQGSRRPYGYESDLVTLNEPEATVLREMGQRIIAGQSYRDVAYWANEQGHTTTTGRPWLALTIRNMLLKPRYGGIRSHNGAMHAAIWQPVFDPATWERLQLTIKLRKDAAAGKPTPRKYLLTGLLYCGQCGLPLNGQTKRDRPSRPLRRVYSCRQQGDVRRERGCGGVVRNADALEWFVRESVIYRLDTPALGKLLSERGDGAELAALLGERATIKLRIDSLLDDYGTGLLNRDQLARAKAAAERQLQAVEHRIGRTTSQSVGVSIPIDQTLREAWDNGTTDWRRGLLDLVIKKIDVLPGLGKPFVNVDGVMMRFSAELVDISWRD